MSWGDWRDQAACQGEDPELFFPPQYENATAAKRICARFRAMNPPNGWGDYDSFIKVLREMRAAVPEWPTTWSVWG